MHKKKRWIFVVTFLLSTVAVGFLSASMATDYWCGAKPIRRVDDETEEGAKNVTGGDPGTKFNGDIHFGLFRGYKSLDHGLGVREGDIWVECIEDKNLCGWVWGFYGQEENIRRIQETIDRHQERSDNATSDSDHGLFNFGLWVSTIVFVALGIIWGLVSMGFSILNMATRPIETITGPMGLYLWNSIACLFSLLAIILYVILYYTDLRKNVLTDEDREVYLWTSRDRASLHFSFYFVVVSTILYAVNLLVVGLGGVQCAPVKYGSNMNEKAMDGVMMY